MFFLKSGNIITGLNLVKKRHDRLCHFLSGQTIRSHQDMIGLYGVTHLSLEEKHEAGCLMAFGVSWTGVQSFCFLAVWSWISAAPYLEHVRCSIHVGRCYHSLVKHSVQCLARVGIPAVFSLCLPSCLLASLVKVRPVGR